MKMNTAPAYQVQDNTNRQAQRKVEIHNTGHAMRIFAESTYTRPIEAVVRETIANAMDASRGKPFEITAPSLLDPNFKVRDFGVGMDEDFFLDGYAKVGFSTKRDSNDEVGGFGQGRFAAFAYAACDQFYVRGVKDGKFFLGSVWHDADFEIYVQVENRGDTDEANGVEVIIPVKVSDHGAFYEAIQIFTEFLDPPPICEVTRLTRETLFEGKDKSWKITRFSDYETRYKGHPLRAIMGGIPYKLDFGQVFTDWKDSGKKMNITIADLIFPIGSLAIPASREELRYDEKTIKTIKDKMAAIKDELLAEVEERKKLLSTDFERWTDPSLGQYNAALGDHQLHRVREVDIPDLFLIQDFNKVRKHEGRSMSKGANIEFSPGNHYLIYVLDTDKWRKRYQLDVMTKIRALDAASPNKRINGTVVLLNSDKAASEVFGDAPVIRTSTLPEPPKDPRQPRIPGTPAVKVKRVTKIGKYANYGNTWNMTDCDYSEKDVVYIPGKLTKIDDKYAGRWELVRNTDAAKGIIMVPEADWKRAEAAGWIKFDDWLRSLVTPDILEGLAYVREWCDLRYSYHQGSRTQLAELLLLFNMGLKLQGQDAALQKKLAQIGQVVSLSEGDIGSKMESLCVSLNIDIPTGTQYKVESEFEAFMERHPFFKVMIRNQVFSEAQDLKVDVPTLLAAAKKALA